MSDANARRAPGRPRSEATRSAILETAAQLLEAIPYSQISIERIAADAHVGKQSIYRWWDGKSDVLLEAYTERALKRLPAYTSTGNALADLTALMKQFFANANIPEVNKAIRGLIAEAQTDPEFGKKFYSVFVSTRRAMMHQALAAGVTSGQFRADLDIEMTLELLYGAFWYRLLSGTPAALDDAFAAQLVGYLAPVLTGEARALRPAIS